MHISPRGELNIHLDTFRSSNENNPIVTDRPLSSAMVNDHGVKPLTLCSLNVRSAKSKSADLLDYIYSSGADLVLLLRPGSVLMILRQNSNLSRLARISLCTIID